MLSVIARHQNDTATYAALDARSNALARGLESVGVRKGHRVAVMLGNSMEHAIVCSDLPLTTSSPKRSNHQKIQATYALFKLGAILVSLVRM